MKSIFKFFGTAIIIFALTVSSYGQSTVTATATATILTPISITKNADMDFGNLAGSATAGTVVLPTVGARTITGGASILAGGSPLPASFTVSGVAGTNFTFSVPASIVLVSGGNNMTVDNFVDDAPATIVGGTLTVLLGATLNVKVNQPAGVYTNTTDLIATVNYN